MIDQRYRTFALLNKNKSYTKTAAELFITQPAVSQQIKSLENELQFKLVEYHHPQLQITSAGQKLARFIETTQHQEQKLINQLQFPDYRKKLKFGATQSVSIFMVPALIKKWQPLYHQVNCKVGNTRQILNDIDNGLLDFAILEGNFDKSLYSSQFIKNEKFVAVTRPEAPILNEAHITLTKLFSEPLLIREKGSGTRAIFENWAKSFNVHVEDFQQVIEMGSSMGIINLLSQVGVSFMYQSLITSLLETNHLSIIPVEGLSIVRPISLVYAKNSFFEDEYRKLFSE